MGQRLTVLRVQTLSVGVKPLETGERLSSHVAINQHAASFPRNYLAHFGEHNRDESAGRRRAVARAVPVAVQRRDTGGAGGQEGGDQQEGGRRQRKVAVGGVHCHKLSVRRHPTGKRLSFLSAVHLGARLSLHHRGQSGGQLCGWRHDTAQREREQKEGTEEGKKKKETCKQRRK